MPGVLRRAPAVELREPPLNASCLADAIVASGQVELDLGIHRGAEVANVPLPTKVLDESLCTESDQHAKHDDPHLAGKRSPAMKWLGQVKMHAAAPQLREG
jgi:hypothetical protein